MPFVDTGADQDKINLSDEEFYRKYGYNKEGFSYGFPIKDLAPEKAEVKPDYGWWDVFKSDFMSNPLVVYGQLYFATHGGEVDPNFRLTEENTRGFENDIGALAMAHNEFELNFAKEILKEKYRNQQVIEDSNGLSWFTGKAAGLVFDPAFFGASKAVSAVGGIAKGFSTYKKVKGFAGKYVADVFGKDFAKTAGGTMLYRAGMGAVSGAAIGGAYSGIESLSEDIKTSDVLRNMATFSVLSSVFGGIIGAKEARGASLRRQKADKLIDEISKKQPTEIIVTSEEFEKFRKDPKLAEAKIKNAWGFENFSADPSMAGALSPSQTMRAGMSFLSDVPIKIVDGKTGELMTFTPSVESTVAPIVGQYLRKLLENVDEYYSKWIAEKGGNEFLAKLNLKLWKGGNKYGEFCQEWLNACYNPSSSSSAIINELVRKTSEEIIKPISDLGQKADVFGYQRAKDFELNQKKTELEKGIKSNDREIARIISQRKISVPIGKVNGLMKNQDVTIGAVEKHLKGLEKSLGQNQKRQALLESINKKISPDIKDSKALRKLTQQLKDARASFEKETKENIKQYFSEKIKADTKFETLEEAIDAEEKVVADLIESINLKSDVAIKPSELKELGKIDEKIRVVEKKIKSSSRKQPRQEKLLKTLKMHKSFLEFLSKKSKGTTPAEWKKLGKKQKILEDLIKERDSVFENREKLFEKGEKKQATIEDKLIDALEKLIPEIDKLKSNPNAKLTEGQLRELKGKVNEQLKNLTKEERALIKDKELKTKAIEDARAERSEEVDKLTADTEAKAKEIEETDKAIEENNKKVYTHEDFRKLLDEYYFPRMYDTMKIAAHRDEAVADIKEGMWSISELRDLRNTPEEKLSTQEKKALQKEDERLQQAAEDAVSHILHDEDKAFAPNPRKTRSFEHERSLKFSTEYVKKWIVQDPEKILANFIRTVPVDSKLLERFGTLNINDIIKLIKEDYKKLIENAVSEKQKDALAVQCEKDIDNFRCVWCRVRGINEYSSYDLTRHGIAFNHLANIVSNLTVARLIGGTVISATSDVAQAMMTLGFKRFWKGYTAPFRKDFWKAFSGSEGVWLRAFDHFERTRSLGFYNQMVGEGFLAAIDNFTGRLANLGVKMSCINKWDEFNKFIVGYVTQEGILKAGEKLAKGGKLVSKDLEFLSATGVTEENAVKMFEQFKKYGRVSEGGAWESGVGLWDNSKLQDIFRGGVRKIQNQAILTPTAGSVPLIFDRLGNTGKMILQFRRFSYSTYSKVLMPMLQKKDLEAFSGLTMLVSIGVMKAYLRALKGGFQITMSDAIKQSLSEADCVAYMGDAYGFGSAMLGFNDEDSKGNREALRKAFGTGYDFVNTYFTGIPGLSKLITGLGGDLNYSQIHAIRKMLPLQNNILIYPLFDKFEEVTIEKRGSKRAKGILRKKKKTGSEF
ncbi:MAG: hypothetical protein J6Q61_02800 [Bacteroidales bacterium]|nr:hypothetical protein [Bacteroidales bacterium]MBO5853646.1 hypothetical protein [Bacteroidales bacterium]